MKNKLMALLKDDAGQAMTEYGLILALIAVVVVGVLGTMGKSLLAKFTTVDTNLQ